MERGVQQGQREMLGKRPAPQPGHGIARRSLAACRARPPRPQGAAVGGSAARPHPRGIPGCGVRARRALHTCPAPGARPRRARRASSRSGASPPPGAASRRERCGIGQALQAIPENLKPGLSHPCLRLPLRACLLPRGGAVPSQRGAKGSLVVHPARGVREETEKTRAEP